MTGTETVIRVSLLSLKKQEAISLHLMEVLTPYPLDLMETSTTEPPKLEAIPD